MPELIGEDLSAKDENGRPRVRIATVFPRADTIVTVPGIHATQRIAYIDHVNKNRRLRELEPLSCAEEEHEWMSAVDLMIDDDAVLIRPDPDDMELAFEADELLQQVVSKKRIRFLHVLDQKVRAAIQRRGELWRINPLPRSPEEMKRMITASRIGICGREIYYYNQASGSRLLTYDEFCKLGGLPEHELRELLEEIRRYSVQTNLMGNREICFFTADDAKLAAAFQSFDLAAADRHQLLTEYESLRRTFFDAVDPVFRRDDVSSPQWRSQMYAALIGQKNHAVSEETLLGLSAEFFMQIEWVPGARVEDGELILDSVFDEEDSDRCWPPSARVCDETARGFIFNFIRDYGDIEFVNVGRVSGSLSTRQAYDGRRGVYLAEVKQRGNDQPILRIIRMQKWGVREHLDEGKDLLSAILESEEYTEYILDRRLGCRQLGMNLSPRAWSRKVGERYAGRNPAYHGVSIWSAYFERDYFPGLATDKIPSCKFADDVFADRFARLLGRAAASNLILGRGDLRGNVVFDDGDELVIEDAHGIPVDILVADHTGTFVDYQRDLLHSAPSYARPVTKRAAIVPNPRAFAASYFDAFADRFAYIQKEYRKRRRAFDTLFKHKRRDEGGSFAYRWERVLRRLDAADPLVLKAKMQETADLS